MMINPVSEKQLKSIPASIPAVSTPLKKVSFRGDAEGDTVEIKGGAEEGKKQISAEDIKNKTEDIRSTTETIANSTGEITDNVAKVGKDVTGMFASIGLLFSKLIPTPVKDFFAPPVIDESTGEIVKKLTSDGKEIAKRTFSKKNTLTAVAIAAAVGLTVAAVKHFKNKSKQKTQQA